MSSGLLVVKRFNGVEDTVVVSASGRPKHDGNVALAYRGFDGEPWPLSTHPFSFQIDDGLAHLSQLVQVRRYYELASTESNCDLVYVCDPESPAPADDSLVFLGYDYGYYESEMELYSAIYHEILQGSYGELRAQATLLNADALFSTVEDARHVVALRGKLLESGADLETNGIDFKPIAIYDPGTR